MVFFVKQANLYPHQSQEVAESAHATECTFLHRDGWSVDGRLRGKAARAIRRSASNAQPAAYASVVAATRVRGHALAAATTLLASSAQVGASAAEAGSGCVWIRGLDSTGRDSVQAVAGDRGASLRDGERFAPEHGPLSPHRAKVVRRAGISLCDWQRRVVPGWGDFRRAALEAASDWSALQIGQREIFRRMAQEQLLQRARYRHLPDREF